MTDTALNPENSSNQPEKAYSVESLTVKAFADQDSMAAAAAVDVGDYLSGVLRQQETARAILATGNSQILFLSKLIERGGVDWSRVELFHMDEYLGLSADHSASFRRYMKERVESLVRPKAFHYLDGSALLPLDECKRYSDLLKQASIDLCCLGVGENGHIAFNDPPVANFEDPYLVKIVQLDASCKEQQVGEGHFSSMETVPGYALTLTIPALCASNKMVCLAPERRKSQAIHDALKKPVSTDCPASFLRTQSQATLYLDRESSILL